MVSARSQRSYRKIRKNSTTIGFKDILRNYDWHDNAYVKKGIGLVGETTTFYVHQVAKSLWPQNNYDVKWPIFKFSRGRERQDAQISLDLSEFGSGHEVNFQWRFNWRHRCGSVTSLKPVVAPYMWIRIPENFSFWKFRIWNSGNFDCGIRNRGLWKSESY